MKYLLIFFILFAPQQDFIQLTVDEGQGITVPIRQYSASFNGAPVIVVVHDWGGSMTRWDEVAEKLREYGFSIIVMSLRGHNGETPAYYRYPDTLTNELVKDVAMVVRYAKKKTAGEVYLVGEGLGANLALWAAVDNEDVSKIVAISPGLDYNGVKLTDQMAETLAGKVLLMASKEDSYSIRSIMLFTKHFPEQPETRLYSNAGHGVWIFKRLPESLVSMARWLTAAAN